MPAPFIIQIFNAAPDQSANGKQNYRARQNIPQAAALGALAFGVCAVARSFCNVRSLNIVARCYTALMRGTPLLVQLYLFYFMFGNIFGLGRMSSGVLALALFEGAFAAEIIRAGVAAVPRGQTEAALVLNLRPAARWRRVILPQAAPLILPPLARIAYQTFLHCYRHRAGRFDK